MSNIRMPKQKRSIEKRNRIIEKGFELICKNGYYNTNTNDIAKYANVSTGIVYQYFNDKKEIFLEGINLYYNSIMFPILDVLDFNKDLDDTKKEPEIPEPKNQNPNSTGAPNQLPGSDNSNNPLDKNKDEEGTKKDDDKKEKLRGAIRFFTGEMNNIQLQIINGERKDMAGGIYLTEEILSEFKDLIGNDRVKIDEI